MQHHVFGQPDSAVPPPAAPPPQKKSSKGLWVVIVLLLVFLIGSMLVNLGLFAGLVAKKTSFGERSHFAGYAVDEYPDFSEEWSYGEGGAKVVRIAVHGVIMRGSDGGLFDPGIDRIEHILQQIRAATHDSEVKGLIVEVDSPGGAITPSDEIYEALMRFREGDEERKVLVFMRDLAASGGYYVAIAGDYLMAEPTTIVGSIGVIMQSINMKGLSEKIGIHDVTIKSGDNKDFLNPFQDVDPAQVALLQGMIDEMHERFAGLVQERRGLSDETMDSMADGRIWSSDDALENGFIDGLGYWDEAVHQMAELLDEEEIKVVRYTREVDLWTAFSRVQNPLSVPRVLDSTTPRFLYLWKP